jgi:hypothetical protein
MTIQSPEDAVESIKWNPQYGYNGQVNDIRRREYAHLGGFATIKVDGLTRQKRSIWTMQGQLRIPLAS